MGFLWKCCSIKRASSRMEGRIPWFFVEVVAGSMGSSQDVCGDTRAQFIFPQ